MTDKIKDILRLLAARLKEPSTYAGLAAIVGVVTRSSVSDVDVQMWADIGAGVAAVLAIALREKGGSITVTKLPEVK